MKYLLFLLVLPCLLCSSPPSGTHPVCTLPELTDPTLPDSKYKLSFSKTNATLYKAEIQDASSPISEITCTFGLLYSSNSITNVMINIFQFDTQQVVPFTWTDNSCTTTIDISKIGYPSMVYTYLLKTEKGFLNYLSGENVSTNINSLTLSDAVFKKANDFSYTESKLTSIQNNSCGTFSRGIYDHLIFSGFVYNDPDRKIEIRDVDDYISILTNVKSFVFTYSYDVQIIPGCMKMPNLPDYKEESDCGGNFNSSAPSCGGGSSATQAECDFFTANGFGIRCGANDVSDCPYCCANPNLINDKLNFSPGLNFVYIYFQNDAGGAFEIGLRTGNFLDLLYGYRHLTSYDVELILTEDIFNFPVDGITNSSVVEIELAQSNANQVSLVFSNSDSSELFNFLNISLNAGKKARFYLPPIEPELRLLNKPLSPTTDQTGSVAVNMTTDININRPDATSNIHFLTFHKQIESKIVFRLLATEKIHFPENYKLAVSCVSLTELNTNELRDQTIRNCTNLSTSNMQYLVSDLEITLNESSISIGKYKLGSNFQFEVVNLSNPPDYSKTLSYSKPFGYKGQNVYLLLVLMDSNGNYLGNDISPTVELVNKSNSAIKCTQVSNSNDLILNGIRKYEIEFTCSTTGYYEFVIDNTNSLKEIKILSDTCIEPKNKYVINDFDCVETCPSNLPFHFSLICLEECHSYVPFYLNDKTCVATCPKKANGNECVDSCEEGQFEDKGNCLDSCPEERKLQDNGVCVDDCNGKYLEDLKCVDKCTNFHREDLKCVDECSAPYSFRYYKEEAPFCLYECPNGLVGNAEFHCVKIPVCKEKQQIIDFKCVNCRSFQFWLDGKCLNECPEGYITKERICIKCSEYIYNGECISTCPEETEGVLEDGYKECASCSSQGKVVEEGKCVDKCSQFKILKEGKCSYCSEAFENGKCVDKCEKGTTPHTITRVCLGCGDKYAYDDGICTSDCPYFAYTDGNVKRCIKCGFTQFFYLGECVNKCPPNTEPLMLQKKCQPLPTNCKIDGFKCQNNSKCIQSTSSYASCACTSDRIGSSCTTRKDKLQEESDELVSKFQSSPDLNLIRAIKAVAAVNPSVASKLIAKVDALIETTKDQYFLLELLDISLIPDKSEVSSNRVLEILMSKVRNISKRVLKDSSISFNGLNFKYAYGNDISNLIDISGCKASIQTENNISAESIIQEYFEFNIESSKHLDSKLSGFKINSSPLIIVFFYYLSSTLSSANCSTSDLEIEFSAELEDKAEEEKLLSLSDKGINPFDSQEEFFTDICSLKQGSKDVTLLSRKEDFLFDSDKVCGIGMGIQCKVESLDEFNRPICICGRGNQSFGDIVMEYLTFLSETNIRLVKCYSVFFSVKSFSAYGFWSSLVIILSFYILQIISHTYTKRLLQKANLSSYLQETIVNIDQEPEDLIQKTEVVIKISNKKKKKANREQKLKTNGESKEKEALSKNSISARSDKSMISRENRGMVNSFKSILKPKASLTNLDLNSASFEQQLKFDNRSIMYFVSRAVLKFHPYIDVIFNKHLYFPLHMRLFVLMSSINLEFALNALFFTDEAINKRAEAENPVFS